MVDYYNYSVDLPFSKIKIHFRELNTREQLFICKANLSFANDKESLFYYHKYVYDVICNCVKNIDDLKQINIVEYILFLTKLRSISIGSTINFIANPESKTKTKIQIDLKNYLLDLYNAANYFEPEENNTIIVDDFKVRLNWPNLDSVDTFLRLLNEPKDEYTTLDSSLGEYVKEIVFRDLKIPFSTITFEEKNQILNKTPLLIKLKTQEKVINACKKLFESDVFKVSFFSDYKFNLYNLSFIEHIKMLFAYDLKSLYSEIYFLSANNLPPEYVMSISSSERKLYTTIINEQNQKRDETPEENINQNVNPESGYGDSVRNLALEFGQNPPK